MNLNSYKAGGFIWRSKEQQFTKEELKKLNCKNAVVIIKMNSNGEEVKRYNSIKETVEDNPILSRNILDRISRNGEIRDGYMYKCPNQENKITHLTTVEKKEIKTKNNLGKSVSELAKEYNKVEKHIRNILNSKF